MKQFKVNNQNVVISFAESNVLQDEYISPESMTDAEFEDLRANIGRRKYVGGNIQNYTPPPVVIDWDTVDPQTINNVLSEKGSVIRSVVETMLDEINSLRQQAGLTDRTQGQIKAAIIAKMKQSRQ